MNNEQTKAVVQAKIKLSYFDFSGGRGEECRLAFFIANVDFEDNRVVFEDWATLKPTTPFGEMPFLEIEGEGMLAQSNAILWLIGTRYSLLPENSFQALQHYAILNTVEDLMIRISDTMSLEEEAKKLARVTLAKGYMQDWAKNVEKQIQGPLVAGDTISIADVKLFVLVRWLKGGDLDHMPANYFDDYPKLNTLHDTVLAHPKVTQWYEMEH